MLILNDKKECYGCTACMAVCPKQCISMKEDAEGFLYPQINASLCIDCQLCNQVCPTRNKKNGSKPIATYAVKNKDSVTHLASSSGGIFTSLAQYVLQQGGVIYGAAYDNQGEVRHISVETNENLARLRGSKYVQSQIGNCYLEVKKQLKEGRQVLFSGTPCQVAGLRNFLRKDYCNLLTVDLVCNSVPSPRIWRDYLKYINPKGLPLGFINMRDKKTSWRKSRIIVKADNGNVLLDERGSYNLYIRGFKSRNYTRPSCFACKAKNGQSGSDLTLGDFWGIKHVLPQAIDSKGVGLLLIRTERGAEVFRNISCEWHEADYSKALHYNPCIEQNVKCSSRYDEFWLQYEKRGINCINDFVKKRHTDVIMQWISLLKNITIKLFKRHNSIF